MPCVVEASSTFPQRDEVNMLLRTLAVLFLLTGVVSAQPQPATRPVKTQAELEADLSALLTNATLEGSFTFTGSTRLMNDKYTLGNVRKLQGKDWLIQARIQYGGRDVLVPLSLPIEWAGDTPMIMVDDL